MDRRQAAALIKLHRYYRDQETDYAVARRAEHSYTKVAVMMAMYAVYWITRNGEWATGNSAMLVSLAMFAVTLAFAVICYWRSRQFAEIRRQFEDVRPQNLAELPELPAAQPTE